MDDILELAITAASKRVNDIGYSGLAKEIQINRNTLKDAIEGKRKRSSNTNKMLIDWYTNQKACSLDEIYHYCHQMLRSTSEDDSFLRAGKLRYYSLYKLNSDGSSVLKSSIEILSGAGVTFAEEVKIDGRRFNHLGVVALRRTTMYFLSVSGSNIKLISAGVFPPKKYEQLNGLILSTGIGYTPIARRVVMKKENNKVTDIGEIHLRGIDPEILEILKEPIQ